MSAGQNVDTYCLQAKPIYVHRDDVLTDDTVNAIHDHNEHYLAECGGDM